MAPDSISQRGLNVATATVFIPSSNALGYGNIPLSTNTAGSGLSSETTPHRSVRSNTLASQFSQDSGVTTGPVFNSSHHWHGPVRYQMGLVSSRVQYNGSHGHPQSSAPGSYDASYSMAPQTFFNSFEHQGFQYQMYDGSVSQPSMQYVERHYTPYNEPGENNTCFQGSHIDSQQITPRHTLPLTKEAIAHRHIPPSHINTQVASASGFRTQTPTPKFSYTEHNNTEDSPMVRQARNRRYNSSHNFAAMEAPTYSSTARLLEGAPESGMLARQSGGQETPPANLWRRPIQFTAATSSGPASSVPAQSHPSSHLADGAVDFNMSARHGGNPQLASSLESPRSFTAFNAQSSSFRPRGSPSQQIPQTAMEFGMPASFKRSHHSANMQMGPSHQSSAQKYQPNGPSQSTTYYGMQAPALQHPAPQVQYYARPEVATAAQTSSNALRDTARFPSNYTIKDFESHLLPEHRNICPESLAGYTSCKCKMDKVCDDFNNVDYGDECHEGEYCWLPHIKYSCESSILGNGCRETKTDEKIAGLTKHERLRKHWREGERDADVWSRQASSSLRWAHSTG